ncbi:MAG TPA: hypothetical protein VF928_08950 [Usitatibacteraceae bacterium]
MPTNNNPALERKVEALYATLAAPRPDDIDWCDELLTRLEEVAEYSLHPGVPVRALSRTLNAAADELLSAA